jgi:hydroxymethylglutaryl-CoA reductase
MESLIVNAKKMAGIWVGVVLVGELCLVFALATGQLVNNHMKFKQRS